MASQQNPDNAATIIQLRAVIMNTSLLNARLLDQPWAGRNARLTARLRTTYYVSIVVRPASLRRL
ncbi:protein of unknown function [Nitrospira japonica]|uniref:Uncharacterized protein n=1 Tax=Nitrospira japonica TaxID=1325564 RepID=A0A1W1I2J9_9BACT|nr:protein of unknown function [Nitrospira japonica]